MGYRCVLHSGSDGVRRLRALPLHHVRRDWSGGHPWNANMNASQRPLRALVLSVAAPLASRCGSKQTFDPPTHTCIGYEGVPVPPPYKANNDE